jgi:SHS family lactate transporter-like MFS transporter
MASPATQSSPAAMTAAERANQRNAVLAGFLGWTLDAFDFFVLTFVIQDVATAFGRSRADIAGTVGLALITRPVGAIIFGLVADRYGRRIPLMLNVIFYAIISVLCGLAPNYMTFVLLRLAFGIGMGGEWGVGASLALESASPRLRGLLSGLLQEGYALGNLLAALAYRSVYVSVHASHPDYAWRVMFFLGGAPALLSLFIRAKVKESEAWHEHRVDWQTYRSGIWQHWPRFVYLVLMMTMMAFMSHGTQDMYPTFLQHERQYSPSDTASLTIITNIGAICGGLAFGWYSDQAGRRRAMITSALFGMLTVPLWVLAPGTALIALGGFLIQFFVQGCWGVIPAHINELSPPQYRGFFPGLAYQLGAAFTAGIPWLEATLAEHFTYSQAMAGVALTVMLGVATVSFFGPEAHRVAFRKRDAVA